MNTFKLHHKPAASGPSPPALQITESIALGIILSATQFVAARDADTPHRFELLIPANNAVAHATTYGNTPLLAWQESSDSGSGIDHYEVWLDGAKVDRIPAGVFGHLAGENASHEPFRPYGFLAAEKVCYYLWCGATDWSEAINRYTNNVIGDADDRVLPENTLVVDMVSQSRFIQNQTSIYRLYKDEDPAYADKCLKAASRCYDYFAKTWPVVTDYETTFNARPYQEKISDLMPLAYGVRANLSMFLATDNPANKDRAVNLADQLMALQEKEYIEGQTEVKGYSLHAARSLALV